MTSSRAGRRVSRTFFFVSNRAANRATNRSLPNTDCPTTWRQGLGHQDKRVNPPGEQGRRFLQELEKMPAIAVVAKEVPSLIAARRRHR